MGKIVRRIHVFDRLPSTPNDVLVSIGTGFLPIILTRFVQHQHHRRHNRQGASNYPHQTTTRWQSLKTHDMLKVLLIPCRLRPQDLDLVGATEFYPIYSSTRYLGAAEVHFRSTKEPVLSPSFQDLAVGSGHEDNSQHWTRLC